jgi:phosphoglycolate phosphatase
VIGLDNIYAGSKTHLGLTLVEQLNLPKDEILFIGDTLHDAEVAEAMGVNCILIASGHQVKEILILNHNMVLENMNQLQNFLEL